MQASRFIVNPTFPSGDRLLRHGLTALAAFGLLAWLDMRASLVGELLRPIIGDPATSGWMGRAGVAAFITVLLTVNIYSLKLLPKDLQVPVVWMELLALFLLFFWSFDLDYGFIRKKIGFLIAVGATTTLYISMISIAIASVIALAAALAKLSDNPVLYATASFYISFFRGLPLLMQIYLIYLGLPQIGFVIDPVPAGITALSVCYGAYMAEIFRAGIQGVDKGQREAAFALGLRPQVTFFKVIFPQAMRLIIPPTGNQFISMLKDSSLVSVVGVWELTFLARTQGKSEFKHIEMLITAAMVYWVLSICCELVQARIEQHYGKGDKR